MKFNSTIFLSVSFLFCILCTLSVSAQQPVEFVENKGQWDNSVLYKGQIGSGAFYLQRAGFSVLMYNTDDLNKMYEKKHGHSDEAGGAHAAETAARKAYPRPGSGSGGGKIEDSGILRSHIYKVEFEGGNANALQQKEKPLASYNNYFIGNDPSKWASACKIYQAVTYKGVYPNIDIRYYASGNDLKYDIIVHPGGNVNDIVMNYEGAEKLQIKKGELIIQTSVGNVKELSPYTYQLSSESGRKEITCKYVIEGGNKVRFKVKEYDPSKTLVIDPTMIFATFTGSLSNQWGFTATYGSDGSLYSGGIVFGDRFLVSPGAYQSSWGGGEFDIGIMKFNSNGTNRVYATYIGGSDEDQPHSLVEDSQGNLVVMGRTRSPKSGNGAYPLKPAGNIQNNGGGFDIVVTKLNRNGTDIIGSKRIGGTGNDGVNSGAERTRERLKLFYGDDSRSEVIVDGSDNIYFVSSTESNSNNASERFPTTAGAAQSQPGGDENDQDGVLVKLSPDVSTLLYSTRIGGAGDDGAYVIAINPVDNNIYIAGATSSKSGFPGIPSSGVVNSSFQGGDIDGFISIFSSGGSLLRSTYIGAQGQSVVDAIYGLKFDPSGFPYITGVTLGNWQVTPGAYNNPGGKQFIVKLQPDLSAVVYSTVFGSTTNNNRYNISPVAFSVDQCENVYVAGWGGSVLGAQDPFRVAGTNGMPVKGCSVILNGCRTDGQDFYFFVLKRDAADILFGAFYGLYGGLADHVDGGTSRFDARGIIYQAICAACNIALVPGNPRYPTTPGAWRVESGSPESCNLAALKIEMNFSGVLNGLRPSINGIPYKTYGCVPLTVDFIDTLQRGRLYIWDFGDGNKDTTTTFNTSNTYNSLGTYQVTLISIDSSQCIIADTAYTTIRVRQDRAALGMNYAKIPPCDSLSYDFINNSVAPPGKPFTDTSFVWDFGDGSPTIVAGLTTQQHTYASPGTYNVILTLKDTSYCNGPESDTMRISVAANVKAIFETDPGGCVPHTAVFENTSEAGQTYLWTFGDGASSTDFAPTHVYDAVGTYTVKLVVTDPNTCNKVDSTTRTITVRNKPTAGFTFSPAQPQENTPTSFTNTSIGAVRYSWDFGDGETSTLTNPVHQYNKTATYNACLIAYNEFGCPDTLCQPVSALVSPLIAVPSAFSPNGDGVNDYVYVRGYAIDKMVFRIYNRWGQLVFQTADRRQGWDGKYKGVVQPMDAYAYTLEVEFTDGTRATKQGDITLLR
ncbi:MAG: PKD domain-containing protein [Agriterribacter sp.]